MEFQRQGHENWSYSSRRSEREKKGSRRLAIGKLALILHAHTHPPQFLAKAQNGELALETVLINLNYCKLYIWKNFCFSVSCYAVVCRIPLSGKRIYLNSAAIIHGILHSESNCVLQKGNVGVCVSFFFFWLKIILWKHFIFLLPFSSFSSFICFCSSKLLSWFLVIRLVSTSPCLQEPPRRGGGVWQSKTKLCRWWGLLMPCWVESGAILSFHPLIVISSFSLLMH